MSSSNGPFPRRTCKSAARRLFVLPATPATSSRSAGSFAPSPRHSSKTTSLRRARSSSSGSIPTRRTPSSSTRPWHRPWPRSRPSTAGSGPRPADGRSRSTTPPARTQRKSSSWTSNWLRRHRSPTWTALVVPTTARHRVAGPARLRPFDDPARHRRGGLCRPRANERARARRRHRRRCLVRPSSSRPRSRSRSTCERSLWATWRRGSRTTSSRRSSARCGDNHTRPFITCSRFLC